jgi:hypothetical protein
MLENNGSNIIIFFLFIIVIYLMICQNYLKEDLEKFKKNTLENFTNHESITITEAIKNLSCLASEIQNANGTLTIPANLVVEGNFTVKNPDNNDIKLDVNTDTSMTSIHKLSVTTDSRFNDDVVLHNAKKIVFKPPSAQDQNKISYLHNYGTIGGSSVMTQLVLQDHDRFKIRHQTTGSGAVDSHSFYKYKAHIYNADIGRGSNESQFTISHRNKPNTTQYSFKGTSGGWTYINAFNGKQVEITRDNNIHLGRLQVPVLRTPNVIPNGQGDFHGLGNFANEHNGDGLHAGKFSRAICMLGLQPNDELALIKIERPHEEHGQGPSFMSYYDNHNNGHQYITVRGREDKNENYKLRQGNSNGAHIHIQTAHRISGCYKQ